MHWQDLYSTSLMFLYIGKKEKGGYFKKRQRIGKKKMVEREEMQRERVARQRVPHFLVLSLIQPSLKPHSDMESTFHSVCMGTCVSQTFVCGVCRCGAISADSVCLCEFNECVFVHLHVFL